MANREEALKFFLNEVIYSDDNSDVVGKNASPYPELKIMFEEYGLDENDDVDTSQKCYSIFIHKHAGDKDFIFPDHESNGFLIIHRPEEEVYFRAWYDNGEDALYLNDTDEAIEEASVSSKDIDSVLNKLYKKYSQVKYF